MAEPLFTDDDAKDISYCNVRAVQNDIAQGPARGTTTYLIKDAFKVRWHLARASRPPYASSKLQRHKASSLAETSSLRPEISNPLGHHAHHGGRRGFRFVDRRAI